MSRLRTYQDNDELCFKKGNRIGTRKIPGGQEDLQAGVDLSVESCLGQVEALRELQEEMKDDDSGYTEDY
jgi:hypothetical protein